MIDAKAAARDAPLGVACWRRLLQWRVSLTAIGIAGLLATIIGPPAPRLLWNATASAPIGLYAVNPNGVVARGGWVVAWPPSSARDLAAERRYLPRGVPLVKRVAAIPGDQICALGDTITIDGQRAVTRRAVDAQGRPMPMWRGCLTLRRGADFLLAPGVSASFDGRYFGPSAPADIIGTAEPLWLR